MKNIFDKVKSFFIRLSKLTAKQATILILILSEKLFSTGVYFIAFYFIFYYNPSVSVKSNIPGLIMLGLLVSVWFSLKQILELQIKKTEEQIKNFMSVLVRGFYSNRFIILFGGTYYYLTFKFTQWQILTYVVVVIISKFVGKYIQSWMLRLQHLDWSALDE